MSSTTTTTDAAATTAAAAMERQTYRCHECDTSVSLLPPSSLPCPHCRSDFLERLDSPLSNPNSSPDPNLSQFPIPVDPPSLSPPHQTPTATNDNYLLDSTYLRRLIQQIANSDSENPSPFLSSSTPFFPSPASRAAVEAIPTIKITASLLELDPILLCAVCKDPFATDDEAKQLPCKHIYHPCCILPWLSQRNSCPVCRFLLPTENNESTERARRRMSSGLIAGRRRRRPGLNAAMLRDLMTDSTVNTMTDVARRQEQSGVEEESLVSPAQVGEAEAGLVERSVESVSSWLVEGGDNAGAGGNVES